MWSVCGNCKYQYMSWIRSGKMMTHDTSLKEKSPRLFTFKSYYAEHLVLESPYSFSVSKLHSKGVIGAIRVKSYQRHGVLDQWQLDCWFTSLYRLTINETPKLRVATLLREPSGDWWVLPTKCQSDGKCCSVLGAVSIRKTVLPGMAIPMFKIRRPNGRLIFNMEIAIRR